ncbi:zinc ribbon domain-containing protein [Gracilibacillus salitolerans]|uniref:Zinc ribbon domain-containing protein n=1 Tax=Gracilibacillus salitolerans TaxID=2663022 RepID=A0A5Q2THZ0_9BACI|nr:zinc ribbon domain-containing protein [Gracilibacillus salitolerans]QGH34356.1 zinc ribbon domain-containing protein [Gracilibacillus salitolerans]
MSFCPHCGGHVEAIETFCVSCGKRLPEDINQRTLPVKPSKKWWLLPIISLILAGGMIGSIFFVTNYQSEKALAFYEEATEMALIGDYEQAITLLEQALDYKENFPAAEEVIAFLNVATEVQHNFEQIDTLNEQSKFVESFNVIRESEDDLQKFNGDLTDQLLEQNIAMKNQTLLKQATYKLNNNPTTDELKALIWEIEDITHDKATELQEEVHQKLVSMTYQEATTLLEEFQFSQALRVIEDTLKAVESSEQLESLKTTVNKEKTAFESAQEQRIEQALSAFEEEQELNESHAIELIDIQVQKEKDNWIITGQLKSVATVPIHSILVSYSVHDKDEDTLVENDVYVFPETLYPNEVGNFEFTHFDVDTDYERLTPKVEEITWYLD